MKTMRAQTDVRFHNLGLLEEKGVHHDTPGKKDSSPSSGGNKDDHHHHSKDKPSLGERIKNKLHRHKE